MEGDTHTLEVIATFFELPRDGMTTDVYAKRLEWAMTLRRLGTSLAEAEALIRKNADMINGYLAKITELESQLAEYRKPMESMDTEQLTDWNAKLTELLYAPDSEREHLPWQIAVGDHLEKFAKSWNSSRIAELESQILHQTAISACRIEERERLQAQIATLKEIAIEERARYLEDFIHEFDPVENRSLEALRQLSEEHPEAFR